MAIIRAPVTKIIIPSKIKDSTAILTLTFTFTSLSPKISDNPF